MSIKLSKRNKNLNQNAKRVSGLNKLDTLNHIEILLTEILQFAAPADLTTGRYLRDKHYLDLNTRSLIVEAIYIILRYKSEFDYLASYENNQNKKNYRRKLSILGLAQSAKAANLAQLLSQEDQFWLAQIRVLERKQIPAAIQTNLPSWLLQELERCFNKEEINSLSNSMLAAAPLDLRTNCLKSTRDSLLQLLATNNIQALATPFAPHGIRLACKQNLSQMPWFINGFAEVQDEGSQLLVCLLEAKRGELVVDFCAGSGGKTLAVGAIMRNTGRLYAIDIAVQRLNKLKLRLARSGLSNVHSVLIDSENDGKLKRIAGKADRVLVDAPCSGLGTLRRNPDLKWRHTKESITQFRQKQQAILQAGAKLVKVGGRLVYATCSILDIENQMVVEDFLNKNPNFVRMHAGEILAKNRISLKMGLDLQLWPHIHNTDGFYAAVFTRNILD